MQTNFNSRSFNMALEAAEIQIPMPSGHVAAKSWGHPDGLPIIGVHGLQDNAATFDRLAPLLPTSFHLVSIDLPGHGLSSHLPKGTLYNFLDMIQVISRIANHFNWKKFYYLGHSLGGQIGTYYASLYPERVIKLVILDPLIILPWAIPENVYIAIFKNQYKKLLEVEKKLEHGNKEPCYTYEEAKGRLFAIRFSELTPDAADILLNRSLRPNNGGYTFRLDQSVKGFVFPMYSKSQQVEIIGNLRCPFLLIKASESLPAYEKQELITLLRMNSSVFEEIVVEGNHEVHLIHPERISTAVSTFLLHSKSHL